MSSPGSSAVAEVLDAPDSELLTEWIREQLAAATLRADLLSEAELRQQSGELLGLLRAAVRDGDVGDIAGAAWAPVREMLESLSRSRARQGFRPAETATFIFSLKQPLFARLRAKGGGNAAALPDALWAATVLVDKLGIHTLEAHLKGREEVIQRQQQEMLELSTPVVKIWDGVLALPLIGTLDSARTQIVLESLLGRIVETGSGIAIIDITGVPTVDTLVAQHLLKAVAAARLMGAECIISGIRPQIAQTMVHLGVAMHDVVTKATLADAVAHAFQRLGLVVVRPSARG